MQPVAVCGTVGNVEELVAEGLGHLVPERTRVGRHHAPALNGNGM